MPIVNSYTSNSDTVGSLTPVYRLLGVTFVWLVVFIAASEWLLQTHAIPSETFYEQRAMFQRLRNTPELVRGVAIGDSHMEQDFVASADMLNFAYHGENLTQMRGKLEVLLDSFPGITQVLLTADPHLFADYRYVDDGRRVYPDALLETEREIALLDPYLRERLGLYWKKWLQKGTLSWERIVTPYGSVLLNGTLNTPLTHEQKHSIHKRMEEHKTTRPFEGSLFQREFDHMLEMLASRHIQVCMIEFPVVPYHRQLAKKYTVFDRIREYYRRVARKYGFTYVSYWDAFDDHALYRNGDHLNREGATRLTAMIRKDCTSTRHSAGAKSSISRAVPSP